MKQLKIKIFILMVYILLFCILVNPVFATSSSNKLNVHIDDIKTNSPSCILVDSNSGKILYAKNAYSKMYPASTTKLMTAILTLENCKLTDSATVSHNAIYSIPVGYSHANLK